MYSPPFSLVSATSPRGCSHEEIKTVFLKYGKLFGQGLRFSTAKKDDRFYIDFAMVGSAMKAFKALNGQPCEDLGLAFRLSLQYTRETKMKLVAMGLLEETTTKITMPQRMPPGPICKSKAALSSVLTCAGVPLKPASLFRPLNQMSDTQTTSIDKLTISSLRTSTTRRFAKDIAVTRVERDRRQVESLMKRKQPFSITPILPLPFSPQASKHSSLLQSQSNQSFIIPDLNSSSVNIPQSNPSSPLTQPPSSSANHSSSMTIQLNSSLSSGRERSSLRDDPFTDDDSVPSSSEREVDDDETDSLFGEPSTREDDEAQKDRESFGPVQDGNPGEMRPVIHSESRNGLDGVGSAPPVIKNAFLELLAGLSNPPIAHQLATNTTSLCELVDRVPEMEELSKRIEVSETKQKSTNGVKDKRKPQTKKAEGLAKSGSVFSLGGSALNTSVMPFVKPQIQTRKSDTKSEPSDSTGTQKTVIRTDSQVAPYMTLPETVVVNLHEIPQPIPNSAPASSSVKIQTSALISAVKETIEERKQRLKDIEAARKSEEETRAVLEKETRGDAEGEKSNSVDHHAADVTSSKVGSDSGCRKRLQLTRRIPFGDGELNESKSKRRLLRPLGRKPDGATAGGNSNIGARANGSPFLSTCLDKQQRTQADCDTNHYPEFSTSLNGSPLTLLEVQQLLIKAQESMAVHSGLFLLESTPPLIQFNFNNPEIINDWIIHSISTRYKSGNPKQTLPLYNQPALLIPSLPLLNKLKPFQLV